MVYNNLSENLHKKFKTSDYSSLCKMLSSPKSSCSTKWEIVNCLTEILEDYDQAKKAYLLSEAHCPSPFFGLLESMVKLVSNRKQALELVGFVKRYNEVYEYEDSKFLMDVAINKYDKFCSDELINCIWSIRTVRGINVPNVVKKLTRLYKFSPDASNTKKYARDYLILMMELMLRKGRIYESESRLRAIIGIDIGDPEINELRAIAVKRLESASFHR